jgi:hypothetical protein
MMIYKVNKQQGLLSDLSLQPRNNFGYDDRYWYRACLDIVSYLCYDQNRRLILMELAKAMVVSVHSVLHNGTTTAGILKVVES